MNKNQCIRVFLSERSGAVSTQEIARHMVSLGFNAGDDWKNARNWLKALEEKGDVVCIKQNACSYFWLLTPRLPRLVAA